MHIHVHRVLTGTAGYTCTSALPHPPVVWGRIISLFLSHLRLLRLVSLPVSVCGGGGGRDSMVRGEGAALSMERRRDNVKCLFNETFKLQHAC